MLYALLLAFVLSSSNSCARLCLQGSAGGMAMFGGGPPPVTGLGSPPPSYGYGTPPPAGSDDAPRLGYFVSFSVQPVMSSGHDEQCAACWLHSTSTKQCSSVFIAVSASAVHCPVCVCTSSKSSDASLCTCAVQWTAMHTNPATSVAAIAAAAFRGAFHMPLSAARRALAVDALRQPAAAPCTVTATCCSAAAVCTVYDAVLMTHVLCCAAGLRQLGQR